MKILGKLNINPEKVMNNEELMILRGGYGGACCWCVDSGEIIMGAMAASNRAECYDHCDVPELGWHGWWDPYDSTCSI